MLALFSNNNFDKYAKEELESIFTPETRVLCFSGSDIRWQTDNRKELLQGGKYYEEQYAPFKNLGINKDYFYIAHPSDDVDIIRAKFKYADVIFLAGGHMESLEILLKEFDLWNLIKIVDKHIIGVSAGALIQLDKYNITPYIDADYNYYDTCTGLGLLKDVRLIVHYRHDYDKHREILQHISAETVEEMVETNKDIMIVTLSDTEGIIVDEIEGKKTVLFKGEWCLWVFILHLTLTFGQERSRIISKRPYNSVEEMTEDLIAKWNETIKPEDTVYHCGDFGLYKYRKLLNGKIVLICGNYEDDISDEELYKYGFDEVHRGTYSIKYNDTIITMQHEPYKIRDKRHLNESGVINLFGHLHKLCLAKEYGVNVGVDLHNFKPIDIDTVMFYVNGIKNIYEDYGVFI